MAMRDTLLHSQLQEGLSYALMKAPVVPGARSFAYHRDRPTSRPPDQVPATAEDRRESGTLCRTKLDQIPKTGGVSTGQVCSAPHSNSGGGDSVETQTMLSCFDFRFQ